MKVSICMPCHNAERYLAQALDSVLRQSYADLEIIVCDDGSTDSSAGILADYAKRGVRVIRQDNAGAAAARNTAFAASTGDAICFMDCDDLVPPRHVEALVEGLSGQAVIAMGQWDRFHQSPDEARFPDRPTYHIEAPVEFLKARGWNMMQSAMFLLPRELIERRGAWDPTRSPIDDFEFYTRMIASADRLRFCPDAKVFYRSGLTGSLSGARSRTHVEGKLRSLMAGTGHLLAIDSGPNARAVCADVFQAFEFDHYPDHPDLRARARARVTELGGSTLAPDGPPGFQTLRPWIGWKAARHVQRAAERLGLNSAARRGSRE